MLKRCWSGGGLKLERRDIIRFSGILAGIEKERFLAKVQVG